MFVIELDCGVNIFWSSNSIKFAIGQKYLSEISSDYHSNECFEIIIQVKDEHKVKINIFNVTVILFTLISNVRIL